MNGLSPEEIAAGSRLDLSAAIVKSYFYLDKEDQGHLKSLLIKLYGKIQDQRTELYVKIEEAGWEEDGWMRQFELQGEDDMGWAKAAFVQFFNQLGNEIGENCISNPEEVLFNI